MQILNFYYYKYTKKKSTSERMFIFTESVRGQACSAGWMIRKSNHAEESEDGLAGYGKGRKRIKQH